MPCPENVAPYTFDKRPDLIGGGRPKGVRNRRTIIKEWLECLNAEDGGRGDKADELARALIKKAATGDVAAIKEAFDSAYGKIPEKVLTAETEPENIDRDVTDEVLSKIPTEELEKVLQKTPESVQGETTE